MNVDRQPAESGGFPASPGLDVVVESIGRAVVLRVRGELDMLTAPAFAQQVKRHSGADPAGHALVLDLSGVTFLGSAGLAVLAEARNLAVARGMDLRVVSGSRTVLRPIEVSGLNDVLTIVPDLATAIAQVGD